MTKQVIRTDQIWCATGLLCSPWEFSNCNSVSQYWWLNSNCAFWTRFPYAWCIKIVFSQNLTLARCRSNSINSTNWLMSIGFWNSKIIHLVSLKDEIKKHSNSSEHIWAALHLITPTLAYLEECCSGPEENPDLISIFSERLKFHWKETTKNGPYLPLCTYFKLISTFSNVLSFVPLLVYASNIKGKGACATKVMCKCTKQGNKCC